MTKRVEGNPLIKTTTIFIHRGSSKGPQLRFSRQKKNHHGLSTTTLSTRKKQRGKNNQKTTRKKSKEQQGFRTREKGKKGNTASSDLIFPSFLGGGHFFLAFAAKITQTNPSNTVSTRPTTPTDPTRFPYSQTACGVERELFPKSQQNSKTFRTPTRPRSLSCPLIPPSRFRSKPTASPRSETKVDYFTFFCATVRQAGNSYWNLPCTESLRSFLLSPSQVSFFTPSDPSHFLRLVRSSFSRLVLNQPPTFFRPRH